MPAVTRTRRLGAPVDAVWRVVADPHHHPRWWPKVERVEGVHQGRFTQVMLTAKGKPVRADQVIVEAEEPRRVAWEQEVVGTPYERLLAGARTEVALAPAGDGTEVAITLDRRLRGWSRLGPYFFSGAAKKELDAALDGLVQVCG